MSGVHAACPFCGGRGVQWIGWSQRAMRRRATGSNRSRDVQRCDDCKRHWWLARSGRVMPTKADRVSLTGS